MPGLELVPLSHNYGAPAKGSSWKTGLSYLTTMRGTCCALIFMQVLCLVLLGACTEVVLMEEFTNHYFMNLGVMFMMFFGFGYLMTFLKRYGMGAVGFSMLITVVCIQWGILCEVKLDYINRFVRSKF